MDAFEGRPRDSSIIQSYLQGASVTNWLFSAGHIGHPWNDPQNTRPNPQVPLGLLKERLNQYYKDWLPEYRNLLNYAFYIKKYNASPKKAILVDHDHMWWLISPQDMVLLTDGSTSHYTFIHDIDRGSGVVIFRDAWASQFFLLEGRNTVGISAKLIPDLNLVTVSKRDFLKVIVGMITVDTPDLPKHFFTEFPQAAKEKPINLGFAYSFLGLNREWMLLYSLPFLEAALLDDKTTGNQADEVQLAALIFMVAKIGFCMYKTEDLSIKIDKIVEEYGLQQLQDNLDSEQLTKIGQCLCRIDLYPSGLEFFDKAVAQDPEDEIALLSRAKARCRLGDLIEALDDLNRALNENTKKIVNSTSALERIHPYDKWDRPYLQNELSYYRSGRIEELEFKIALIRALGNNTAEQINHISREIESIREEILDDD